MQRALAVKEGGRADRTLFDTLCNASYDYTPR